MAKIVQLSAAPGYAEVCGGLAFPEGGPIYAADGSVIVVEIAAGNLTRVHPDGSKTVIASPGGGPNSSAVGPDGAIYVTQSGGLGPYAPGFTHGAILRVDAESGEVTQLYTSGTALDGSAVTLKAPNDLVFDALGGFYFRWVGSSLPAA